MPERTGDIVLGQLAAVVREALERSPERWSYFTDSGQKGGCFGTLTPLTAADTSLPLAGTSIAAHVHHVAWGLDATAAWIRGDRKARDWNESWKITSVNEEAWTGLVGELRRQYDHFPPQSNHTRSTATRLSGVRWEPLPIWRTIWGLCGGRSPCFTAADWCYPYLHECNQSTRRPEHTLRERLSRPHHNWEC